MTLFVSLFLSFHSFLPFFLLFDFLLFVAISLLYSLYVQAFIYFYWPCLSLSVGLCSFVSSIYVHIYIPLTALPHLTLTSP